LAVERRRMNDPWLFAACMLVALIIISRIPPTKNP